MVSLSTTLPKVRSTYFGVLCLLKIQDEMTDQKFIEFPNGYSLVWVL